MCSKFAAVAARGHVTYVADHGGPVVDEEAAVPPGDRRGGGRGHRAHLPIYRYIFVVIFVIYYVDSRLELQTKVREDLTITEKAPPELKPFL